MKILTNKKLITCIIPKGKAIGVARILHEEKGINTANVSSGRGRGLVEPIGFSGWYEVEILTVVVSEGEANEIFNFIYDKADVGHAHGGIMYQGKLTTSTQFELPKIHGEGQETTK
tara:strand:+ start:6134 stop:6481 length:348 start_codon:yes stop_codon:yes gene_type:complete